jgi:hypothetical protein
MSDEDTVLLLLLLLQRLRNLLWPSAICHSSLIRSNDRHFSRLFSCVVAV